jgi:hypothetical protein
MSKNKLIREETIYNLLDTSMNELREKFRPHGYKYIIGALESMKVQKETLLYTISQKKIVEQKKSPLNTEKLTPEEIYDAARDRKHFISLYLKYYDVQEATAKRQFYRIRESKNKNNTYKKVDKYVFEIEPTSKKAEEQFNKYNASTVMGYKPSKSEAVNGIVPQKPSSYLMSIFFDLQEKKTKVYKSDLLQAGFTDPEIKYLQNKKLVEE